MDRVNLLEVVKSPVNPLNSFQPLQGGLADIVSLHVEHHGGEFRVLSKGRLVSGN